MVTQWETPDEILTLKEVAEYLKLAVEYATLEWVDWFNHRRLLEPTSNIPQAELGMVYYRQLKESAMAA